MNGGDLQLPPGFRFHPTDEELVMHYLCRRCAGLPVAVPIIAELDLYKFDPWHLPGMALYGEKEWYFFSPRERKYPNGSRPNRAAGSGYWKATGADKPVGSPKPVAIKKALVFYIGKAPKGDKTNWIMHEYRLADVDRSARKKNSLRVCSAPTILIEYMQRAEVFDGYRNLIGLVGEVHWILFRYWCGWPSRRNLPGCYQGEPLDDWVLCRIYNKKGSSGSEKLGNTDGKPVVSRSVWPGPATSPEERKPVLGPYAPSPLAHVPAEMVYSFAPSDSMPRLHADSSCSERPEFTCEREVQSQPRWRPTTEWDRALGLESTATAGGGGGSVFSQIEPGLLSSDSRDPFQDILTYLGKPF
ncbi:hypothetical protein C4D60_Mb06t18940 [Musa balbisiana]|uniref:NAC domain-containing protein n=1 Tax=Musa balbisiana TaxID=52838 RepID=A0A4S8IP17_MUSBA|nr:hypothetical protein C4D60_Mb06t18940 [Musa balbisiana]